jgi:Peptidase family C50
MYRREQAALEYEAKQKFISLKEIQWPEQQSRPGSPDEDLTDLLTHLNLSPQKRDTTLTAENLLHGIPAGCTVVSIHLSESKEHFVLSKVHTQGCVVVRLPLLKHPSDADEEPFTFENALAELTNIINLNNETAQAAKDVPDRQAKEAWWTARKELDARLALFLQNMEACWIGGFTVMPLGTTLIVGHVPRILP